MAIQRVGGTQLNDQEKQKQVINAEGKQHGFSAIIAKSYSENVLSVSVAPVPEPGSKVLTNDAPKSVEGPQSKLILPLSA